MLVDQAAKQEQFIATVEQSLDVGWWLVRDQAGRRWRVASDHEWRVGDMVVVLAGYVVGSAGRAMRTEPMVMNV